MHECNDFKPRLYIIFFNPLIINLILFLIDKISFSREKFCKFVTYKYWLAMQASFGGKGVGEGGGEGDAILSSGTLSY